MTRRSWYACALSFGILFTCGMSGCGDPPPGLPTPRTGSLRIMAMDTLVFDSISVGMDDILLGRKRNPCIVDGIVTGTHKLTLIDTSGARADTMVAVRRDELVSMTMRLTKIGPFPGNEAPNFSTLDIDQRNLELASLRGKVVFLIFYEYT
jgi:hypothetical protein